VVSGSGASLSSPNYATTTASFSVTGTFTFRVTVTDGQLSASADVTVTVTDPSLTLYVSKNGNVLKGAMTSVSESTTDSRVKRLDLFIDSQLVSSINGGSLTYKWDLRKLSGTHTVEGMAFDPNDIILDSKSVTVIVK
jgi:hypothetical protein